MSDGAPVQVIVAAFNDEDGAERALQSLKEAKSEHLIGITDCAILKKDDDGKLHIDETADVSGKKGMAIGGVAGGAIGLIAGPALIVPAAIGALVGGLATKMRSSGFDDTRLKGIGESLKPGSSAVLAVVEHKWVLEVENDLANEGADMLTEALEADIAEQLEAGHDVAFTALATQGGFSPSQHARGRDEVESGVVVSEDSMRGVQYIATPGGFAARKVSTKR